MLIEYADLIIGTSMSEPHTCTMQYFYRYALSLMPSRKQPTENPSGNIASPFVGFCTHQQGLNTASAGHIWAFSLLHGFNYHQLAHPQALGCQWATPVIGNAVI